MCAELLKTFRQVQRKRRFLLGYARDPASFIRRLIAASGRDVRQRMDGSLVQVPTAELFKQPWAQEAACFHLFQLESAQQQKQQPQQLGQQQRN